MSTGASPLGRYGELAAAITAVLLVAAAVSVHVLLALGLVSIDPEAIKTGVSSTTWLDAAAGTAVGIVLGQRATTNGAAKIAASAHERIDRLEVASGIDTHTDKLPA